MKNAESHVRDTWDMEKRSNIHLIGATEGVKRDDIGQKHYLKR